MPIIKYVKDLGEFSKPPIPRPGDPKYQGPGGLKRYLHDRGEACTYMSDDGTEIITEYPDGDMDIYRIPAEKLPYTRRVPVNIEELRKQARKEALAEIAQEEREKLAARQSAGTEEGAATEPSAPRSPEAPDAPGTAGKDVARDSVTPARSRRSP